ncbi:hypothetical protein [Streptomyces xylophagus]|uniref:hypothetical protein n=1 Tax=Streptomyces xylophagus TaxID=285514 RepID=UPI0005BE18DC|nr:hypothetical protein [Streptomyces xylophagus]
MPVRPAALAATLTCLLATVGCGASGLTGGGGPELPHTLVGSDYNSVTMLETDSSGKTVTGTLDTSEADGANVTHQHGRVSGTVSGERVTLTVDFEVGGTALKGTLSGSTLTLQAPQPDGQIEDYVLKPHDVAYYNQLVQELQDNATPSPLPSLSLDFGQG